jgi:hypothetical protein
MFYCYATSKHSVDLASDSLHVSLLIMSVNFLLYPNKNFLGDQQRQIEDETCVGYVAT